MKKVIADCLPAWTLFMAQKICTEGSVTMNAIIVMVATSHLPVKLSLNIMVCYFGQENMLQNSSHKKSLCNLIRMMRF